MQCELTMDLVTAMVWVFTPGSWGRFIPDARQRRQLHAVALIKLLVTNLFQGESHVRE
jgi:hypothetical protein